MGKIIAQLKVENPLEPSKGIEISAFVEIDTSYLTLPSAWKDRFGEFKRVRKEELSNAAGDLIVGDLAGPVEVKIGNFDSVFVDLLFIEMTPDEDGDYEPLLGYIPLEASKLAVDLLGHRLLSAKRMDLK